MDQKIQPELMNEIEVVHFIHSAHFQVDAWGGDIRLWPKVLSILCLGLIAILLVLVRII